MDDATKPDSIRTQSAAMLASLCLALALGGSLAALGDWLAEHGPLARRLPVFAEIDWAGKWPLPSEGDGRAVSIQRSGDREGLRIAGLDPAAVSAVAARIEALGRSRTPELDARRERLRSLAREEFVIGPLPAFAPAAENAARLRGASLAMRALAREDAATRAATTLPPEALDAELLAAARSLDPAAFAARLAEDFERRGERLESQARGRIEPDADAWIDRWSVAELRRADGFDSVATVLESEVTPFQREIIDLATADFALSAEAALADPARAWLAAAPAPAPAALRSAGSLRVPLALAFGAIGVVLGAIATRPLRRRYRSRARASEPIAPELAPASDAWLQLVSGRTRADVARGALELASRSLAGVRRVLVVDAAHKLRLEEPFGAEARLGLAECLEEGKPALGLAQHGGAPGLFFLARGRSLRRPLWLELDRLLEELRPHFGRVILALDSDAPSELGSVLAGRWMEAYWAGSGTALPRAASRLESRLAIRFHSMDLPRTPEASLEVLFERLRSLSPSPSAPASHAGVELAEAPAVPTDHEPVVLDCDLQVRQRLRFLAWARRLRENAVEESATIRQ